MSTFVAKDGTQIYFKDWGSGKPVLFSHGWPLDADMWEYQMEYLSSRGFRTIAFDRRGFGRSDQPWTGNDYDTFADDIAQLIEHLDLKDVTLVGFSMGGGDVALVSGGPDGLDPAFRQAAHERIRLSDLTLPHAMVRVLLIEQLYRAWAVIAGHPYHRE